MTGEILELPKLLISTLYTRFDGAFFWLQFIFTDVPDTSVLVIVIVVGAPAPCATPIGRTPAKITERMREPRSTKDFFILR
jgi:hypothetical protein